MVNSLNIAVLGLGTVGASTVEVLTQNAHEITRRAGCELTITTALVQDIEKQRPPVCDSVTLTTELNTIIQDDTIDIVVEALGGIDFAKTCAEQVLASGKHLVTANKALIATAGNELFQLAAKHSVNLCFEAAVAGGIPIIKSLREGLGANQITQVHGIINGTCNFIIDKMLQEQCDFEVALAEAQALGYAEADPSTDVGGDDAGHKIAILASLAFGMPLRFDKVMIEGIADLLPIDMALAQALGYRIKSMAFAKHSPEGVEMRVHPTLIPDDTLLAHVNGVMNAVAVEADAVGTTLYYGAGAGGRATASAIVADLIDVARQLAVNPSMTLIPPLAFQQESLESLPLVPYDDIQMSYYCRLLVPDVSGVLAMITQCLADADIGVQTMIQQPDMADELVPIVVLTHQTTESAMAKAKLAMQSVVPGLAGLHVIRLENIQDVS